MNWNTSWILATILSVSLLSECAAQQAQELVTFKEISQKYGCVTFSPDSTTLAAWGLRGFVVKGDREVADGAVWLWDVPKRKRKDVLQVGGTHADSVAFSSDGKLLAVGCSNGTVQVWDSGTGKKRSDLKGHTVGCGFVAVAFPKDSNTLVSGAWDGTVRHWDVPTGKEKEKLRKTAGGAPVAVTQDGKTIASGGQLSLFDCVVHLWETETGKEKATLRGHHGQLNSVTFSRDGKLVASADWGLPGEKIKPIAKIWEVATGKQQHILAGHSDVIWSVAFSTDGTILASGSSDNTVKLWSVTTGKELTIIKGHSSTVRTLAFSPDGTMLATGSWDHTVKLWDVKAFMKAK